MANIKPNTFPTRDVLDGTEEIYTQTSGTNEKFTVAQVVSLVNNAQVFAVISDNMPDYDMTGTANEVLIGSVFVPNPADIHPEANTIEVKIQAGVYFEFQGMSFILKFISPITGAEVMTTIISSSDGITEIIDVPYSQYQAFGSSNQGTVISLLAQYGAAMSQSDICLLKGLRIIIVATKQ